MARSQETFSKKEREKKRQKRKQDKLKKREEKRENTEKTSLEDMIVYVDQFGNLTDVAPEDQNRKKIDASKIPVSVPKKGEVEDESLKKGKLDYFNNDKGFGFIKELGTQEKFFVHIKGMIDSEIKEGNLVTFEVEQGLKGLNAVRVQKA